MNVNGNDVTITIGADVQKATNQINKFTNAVKGLSSESGRVKNLISKFKGKIKLKIDSSDADKATKKMAGLQKVFSSFKRIAFYRAIRSAIRFVTDGFKEGLENAYQFSKGVGGPLASALDNLSSAGFRMKNQLGAAFGQLLVAVTPILLKLIDIVTEAANAVTQFFALLSGQSTYLKAKTYWKEWGDAASGAGSAAKEALKYLAPFDELNVLPSEKTSSSGGGASTPDYASMFEVADVSESIKKNLQEILPFVEAIGAAIAAWSLSSFLGGNLKTTVGLTLVVSGISLVIGNIAEIKNGTYKFTSGKGTGLAAAGGAMTGLGAAILLGLTGGTALIPIAVGVALSLVISDIVVNWDRIRGKWEKLSQGDFGGAILEQMNMDSWFTVGDQWLVNLLFGEGTWDSWKKYLEGHSEEFNQPILDFLFNANQLRIKVRDAGKNAVENFTSGIDEGGAKLIAWLGEQWTNLTNWFSDQWNALTEWWHSVDMGHFNIDIFGWLGEKWSDISGWFSKKWDNLTSWWHNLDVGSFKFDLIGKITEKWNSFTKWISEKWNSLKKWWQNLSLGEFKIKTPHISWTSTPASGWIANVLSTLGLPTSLPKLNVSWYARGGIVDKASLIGAGEAGKEAIVPLERNTQWVGMVANQLADQLGNRNSGNYNADLADDLEDANGVVVNAIFAATAEIVRAMSRNSGNGQNNSIDIDAVARQVTRWQNSRARAAGI